MKWNDQLTRQNRTLLLKFLDKFSLQQLNTIPKAYRNSIFWNIAHTLVTQQLLTYGSRSNKEASLGARYGV